MKKIFLFEVLHHHECIELPFEALKKSKHSPKLFISSFVNQRLREPYLSGDSVHIYSSQLRKKWIQNRKGFSHLKKTILYLENVIELLKMQVHFLTRVVIEKPDIIYLNTIQSPAMILINIFIILPRKTKVIATMHWTAMTTKNILMFPVYLRCNMHVFLAPYVCFNSKILQSIKRIDLTNRILADVSVFENKLPKKTKQFVFAGKFEPKRKEYETFIKACSELESKSKQTIKVIFLTKRNTAIQSLVDKYGIKDISKTFSDYVEDEEYARLMQDSDFCIISSNEQFYGFTRMSGSYGDAIAYGVPMLINNDYARGFEISGSMRFGANTVDEVLQSIMKNNIDYCSLKKEISEERKKFSVESVSILFNTTL